MNTQVRVTANEAGAVINVSKNNPEYAHIRVEQIKIIFDRKGWVKKKKLSALIAGTVEELKEMDFFSGQELNGNIIIIEQLDPFTNDEPERHYKIAGESGIVCCVDGQPIYRKTIYDTNEESIDTLLQHTNSEDIIQANNDLLAKEIKDKKDKIKEDKKDKEVINETVTEDDNFEL